MNAPLKAPAPAQASSRAPERIPWEFVVLMGSLTAMGPLSIDMYLPAVPAIGAELHMGAAQTQGTVSAFLAGMAIGQLAFGPASDRLGRRPMILFGVVLYTFASLICSFAFSPATLLGGRFVQALGACSGMVISRAVVRDRYDAVETARMLSLLGMISGLAPVLAPLIGSALLRFGSWRISFYVMTAFGVLLTLAALWRLRETRSEETAAHAATEHPIAAYLALFRLRRLWGFGLAGALNGATLFAYVASSPNLLIHTYGVSPKNFGFFFAVNSIALVSSGQLNRVLLRRLTPETVMRRASLSAVVMSCGLALAAITGVGGMWSVLGFLFLTIASFGFLQGNTMAGALSVDPRRAGAISGLQGALSFATGAISSWSAGALYDGTARPMALIMVCALAGSALALRLLAFKPEPAR